MPQMGRAATPCVTAFYFIDRYDVYDYAEPLGTHRECCLEGL